MENLLRAEEVVKEVAKHTDSVLLLHSMSGKDSIALLNLLYPHFRRVACLFEYVVKDLRHIAYYADYAKRKYPDVELYQCPHYVSFTHIKYGYFGMEKDPTQRLYTLAEMVDAVQNEIGIEWSCFGFKQSDSLNRKLLLRSCEIEAINFKTKKFYPLSTYKNADIIKYIDDNNLKKPEVYNPQSKSSGCAFDDYDYMKFLQMNFQDDYKKVVEVYPKASFVVKIHESKNQRKEGNQPW